MAGLPQPLVAYCLDCCFGPDVTLLPDAGVDRFSGGRIKPLRNGSMSSPSSLSLTSSPRSSFEGGDEESRRRFRVRKMNSGNWGQHSLAYPIARRQDKLGFSNQPEQLTFDLQAAT